MRLVLPSNSSYKYFPNNTLTEYTVKLPYSIDLSKGRWEVGLEEIMFYKSWYNVKDASFVVETTHEIVEISLDDGYYDTIEHVIAALNKRIYDWQPEGIQFEVNNATRRCSIVLHEFPFTKITFSKNLQTLLGNPIINNQPFLRLANNRKYAVFRCENVMKLNTIFNLLVYSDIASESIVGDTESSLLRSVAVTDGHWRMQCSNYNAVQYLPVSKTQINSITIYLFTDYGTKVPFEDGRVVCTLDLRQKSPF